MRYTDEENPTVFWADDVLANRYGANDTVLGLNVYRPYLEGYQFSCYGGDQYRRGDDEGERPDLSEIYQYGSEIVSGQGDAVFYPRWRGSSYNNQTLNGSYDDTVYITFRFKRERTITLDANGGIIDGYAKRIYEVPGVEPETQMDADFAKGAYTPVREGHVFCGWYEDEACTIPVTSFQELLKRVSWPVAHSYSLEERALRAYAKWREPIVFKDVKEDTAHQEDILWLADAEISKGWKNDDGTSDFRPLANVARADMAAFLFRLAKSWDMVDEDWEPSGEVGFADVTEKTAHYREVMWLAETGISKGWEMADGTSEFRPLANVARADMAAFIGRLAKAAGRAGVEATDASFFSDVTEKTAHRDEILWMAANKISEGWQMADGTREFRPLAPVARADMAAFLHRLDALEPDPA